MSRCCRSFRTVILSLLTALGTLGGCAQTKMCTIKVAQNTPPSEWIHLAQVSRGAAEQLAFDRLNAGSPGRVVAANLKAEAGCLIWSVELQLLGDPGPAKVHVDAGDGHVLSVEHGEHHSGQPADRAEPWFYE